MCSQSEWCVFFLVVQPPVNITAMRIDDVTTRISWQPVAAVLMYQVTVRNLDDPTIKPSAYNVSDTKLMVPTRPCTNYMILVSSFSKFLVPSEPTNYAYTTNALSPVSSVSVVYTCPSNAVMVSWSSVSGAKSYMATAMDGNGTTMLCTSQSTSCQITGLKCNQPYVVNVLPVSDNCKNLVNTTSATFQTEILTNHSSKKALQVGLATLHCSLSVSTIGSAKDRLGQSQRSMSIE
ncbi:uncharacterized protein [Nothobranchius furzeri]|uniref:uncharacterized protein n=1 Tax=Nothobranchius furzeri TaxID=105023 RepID=UPI003904CED8